MMNRRHLSIRARLILLVLAVVLPAAGLVAWLVVAEAMRWASASASNKSAMPMKAT